MTFAGSKPNSTDLMQLLQALYDAVLVVDSKGIVLFANQAASTLLRKDLDQILGQPLNLPFQTRKSTLQVQIPLLNGRSKYAEMKITRAKWGGKAVRVIVISEIEERRKAITGRLAAEGRIKQHIRNIPLAYIETDTKDSITEWNPAAEKLFGYSRQEALGKKTSELILLEENKETIKVINHRVLRDKEVVITSNKNLTKSGKVITCEWFNTPITDQNGNTIGVMALAQDISERLANDKALQEAEERYRTVVEQQNELIYRYSPDFKFTFVNPAMSRFYGMEAEEMIGKSISIIMLDVVKEEFMHHISQITADNPLIYNENQNVNALGEMYWYSWSDQGIFDKNGEIIEYQAVGRDITDRKLTELALKDSESKYRSLFESFPIGLYRTTPAGEILEANNFLIKMLGYENVDVFRELHASAAYANPADREPWIKKINREGVMRNHEAQWQRKDGSLVWTRENAQVIRDERGKILYYEGSVEDISDRKAFELRQQALYKISEAANIASDLQVLYRTIHEIIGEQLFAKNFYISLYNSKKDTLTFPYYIDENPNEYPVDMSADEFAPGRGLTAYVLRQGTPQLIDSNRFQELVESSAVEIVGTPAEEWLGIPLKTVEGDIIGVLAAQTYSKDVHYTQEDIDLLVFVSTQIAMAIERKKAEVETRQYAERVRSLRTIDQTILANQRPAVIAMTSLEKIHELLPCHHASVFQRDVRTDEMLPLAYMLNGQIYSMEGVEASNINRLPEAVHNGKMYLVEDINQVAEKGDLEGFLQMYGVVSFISFPLMASGKVIGILNIGSDRVSAFNTEHIEIAREIGNSLAVGFYDSRLQSEMQEHLASEHRLNEIAHLITSSLDTRQIIEQVVSLAVELVDADAGTISLVSKDGTTLRPYYVHNLPKEIMDTSMSSEDQTLAWQVTISKTPVLFQDYAHHPAAVPLLVKAGVKSVLGVPITSGGETLGTIGLFHTSPRNRFVEHDIDLASSVAQLAGIALMNARLIEQARRRAEEAETLQQTAAVVAASLQQEKAINLILEQLSRVIPNDGATVQILQDDHLEVIGILGELNPFESHGMHIPIPGGNPNTSVIETGEPFLVEDATSQYSDLFLERGGCEIQSYLGIPLIFQGKTIGMISLVSQKSDYFSIDTIRLASAFADQVAITIQNARLFESVQLLAISDPLTGLNNRRHFFKLARREFDTAIRYERSLSIIMLDLDHFKLVNDNYGHSAGDYALQSVANLLNDTVRDGDLVARYGGEEFILLLVETDIAGAKQVAERIRERIANEPIYIAELDQYISITASLGVASLSPQANNLEKLINLADRVMYEAKGRGRDQVAIWTQRGRPAF